MIAPIPALSPGSLQSVRPANRNLEAEKIGAERTGSDNGFGSAVGNAINQLAAADNNAAQSARAAATGDVSSVGEFMVAATEAQLTAELTVAVRNRAVEAFNDIMRMQI